jgi:hypothetical protein
MKILKRNTESRIDLKHISSGVYLITLTEEKGASFTHKIVIK